jgi:hypothetical protein
MMTAAPILAGIIYVYSVKAFVEVIECGGMQQLFQQSYFVVLPDGELIDVHVISALKPFANCVKLCACGPALESVNLTDKLKINRRRFMKGILAECESKKSRQHTRVLSGFVNGDLPPLEALVSIDDALASESVQIFVTKHYPKETQS